MHTKSNMLLSVDLTLRIFDQFCIQILNQLLPNFYNKRKLSCTNIDTSNFVNKYVLLMVKK